MTVAGAVAGAEIMAKVGAGAENKYFRLRNTGYSWMWGCLIYWKLFLMKVKLLDFFIVVSVDTGRRLCDLYNVVFNEGEAAWFVDCSFFEYR